MNTADVMNALRERYAAPEWAFFEQVGRSTGGYSRGYVDAVAMHLYPSRGLEIHGFEVKVARGDWLRELKKPEKSADVISMLDRWWLVATEGVVETAAEIPRTWGYIVAKEKGLRTVVKADLLKTAPKEIPRGFVAMILRRAHEVAPAEGQVEKIRQAGFQKGLTEGQAIEKGVTIRVRSRYDMLLKRIGIFEQAAGITAVGNEWRGEDEVRQTGEAVRKALDLDPDRALAQFRQHLATIKMYSEQLSKLIERAEEDQT